MTSYRKQHCIGVNQMNKNNVKTEFEAFYYHLSKQLNHLEPNEMSELKTKLRRSCENYCNINEKTKLDDIIYKLSRNNNVAVLKQDKGRGVVLIDRPKYVEKCMTHLNTDNFEKLTTDKTKSFEELVQKTLFRIKKSIGEDTYSSIYPSGSNPGKFYGTAKVHKVDLKDSNCLEELPIRPIISNIGTATHKIARYLSKLLAPLAKSQYTVENSKQFVEKIKNKKIRGGFEMISFDVKSLFTNVPLDITIDIILKKVYDERLINTNIKREDMKSLLLMCTKSVPFTFNDDMYIQTKGVSMGSPLGPLLANVFMCELENTLVPTLTENMDMWTRYVDDTFAFMKVNQQSTILEKHIRT